MAFILIFLVNFEGITILLWLCAPNFLVECTYNNSLGEKCALATNQSVDCRTTILFTISLNSAKVWNWGFNWPVFSVGMHNKSPNELLYVHSTRKLGAHSQLTLQSHPIFRKRYIFREMSSVNQWLRTYGLSFLLQYKEFRKRTK